MTVPAYNYVYRVNRSKHYSKLFIFKSVNKNNTAIFLREVNY